MSSSSVLRSVINPKAPSAAKMIAVAQSAVQPDTIRGIDDIEDMELITTALVENAPVAMAMFDRELRYVLANRQWINDFGLKDALPIVGRKQFDLFPNLHPGWRTVYERALQGHVVRSEHDVQAGPGQRPVAFRWEVRPWRKSRDASVMGIMLTCEKFHGLLTEREETATVTSPTEPVSEAVIRAVLPECGLPVLMLAADGTVCELNHAVRLILPAPERPPLGRPVWEILHAGENGPGDFQQEISHALAEINKGESGASVISLPSQGYSWTLCHTKSSDPAVVAMLVGTPASVSYPPAIPTALASAPVESPPALAPPDRSAELTAHIEGLNTELADLRELEAVYRRREIRHREVLDTIPCGLIVLDERGRPIFQNVHVKDLVGHDLPPGGMVEQWLAAACEDEEASQEVARTWREEVWRRQLTKIISLNTADGLVKDLEFRPSPLPQGGLLLTIHDVSESCHLDEQLRSVEAKLRTLLRECPLPLLLTDASGAVFDANPAAEALFGKSRNALRRSGLDDFLSPESATFRRLQVKNAVDASVPHTSLEVVLPECGEAAANAKLTIGVIQGTDGRLHALANYFDLKATVLPPVVAPPIPAATALPSEPEQEPQFTTKDTWAPLLTTEPSGKIDSWSDEVSEAVLGFTGSQMIGRWLHQLFRPSDPTGFYTELQEAVGGAEATKVWSWFGADGKRGEGEFLLAPLPAGCSAVSISVRQSIQVPAEPEVLAAAPVASQSASQVTFFISPGPAQLWKEGDTKREQMLLTETHHRVKNHLQIISSLLNLQSNTVEDENIRGLLRSSQNRVRAVAALHQHLYEMQLGHALDLAEFATELVERMRECYDIPDDQVTVDLDVKSIRLHEEWLMPLALVMNEALSNAFKHAFPGGKKGHVRLALFADEEGAHFTVNDTGVGLPEEFGKTESMGLGLKVIGVFTDQLKGTTSLKNIANGGLHFHLLFPITCVDI